jgi:D-ala D-ala ligase C-terminus
VITEHYHPILRPTVFAVYESRETWIHRHPGLAGIGLERFLEHEECIQEIADEARQAGLDFRDRCYSPSELSSLIDEIRATPAPLLWNLTDGYEIFAGSNLPALARLLNIPHLGSGSYAQMLCQNKHHLKAVAAACGIPVPKGICKSRDDLSGEFLPEDLKPPFFVKPARLDNGIGDAISSPLCPTLADAKTTIGSIMAAGINDILVEEFLPGPEFTVIAVHGGTWIQDCIRIEYGDAPYFSSTAKDSESYRCAMTSDAERRLMERHASRLARQIGLQDYYRVDFRTDASGLPRLLEVNSSPFLVSRFFEEISLRHFGSRAAMIRAIVHQSLQRQASISPCSVAAEHSH